MTYQSIQCCEMKRGGQSNRIGNNHRTRSGMECHEVRGGGFVKAALNKL